MSPRKSGLGRGLEALIPAAEEAEAAARGVIEVPLASIVPNPLQPRAPIRDQDLVELAASIEEHGIIQPLVVSRAPDGYQLIAGERRWRDTPNLPDPQCNAIRHAALARPTALPAFRHSP